MTFEEEFKIKHPNVEFNPYDRCPRIPSKDYCRGPEVNCRACWRREIPVSIVDKFNELGLPNTVSYNDIHASIKDSGDRTEFKTGAVRYMREGKGRCDLMPLEVVARIINCDKEAPDIILDNISEFQETLDTDYLYKAIGTFERSFDGISTMLLEVAKHFEEGAKKYGESNWQKGIPVHCYIDSAVRHYLKWLRGDNDEPHDRAFVWNIMCCIWEVDFHKNENKNTSYSSEE